MEIKQLTLTDVQELQKISIETFIDTYADSSNKNDLQQYLDNSFSTENLKNEINNQHSAFYVFYNENHQAIAYLKLNIETAQSEQKFFNAL